ncbi:MAG: 4Fe-4S binding protein, partial [Gemmatimonadetes bacterium]|nr:4Fe-4S binding protein [Gemmatimonadota bacterium]
PSPPPYSVEYRTEEARLRTLAAVEFFRRDSAAMAAREGAGPTRDGLVRETDPSDPSPVLVRQGGERGEEASGVPALADSALADEQGARALTEASDSSAGRAGLPARPGPREPAGPGEEGPGAESEGGPQPSPATGIEFRDLPPDVFTQEFEQSVWEEVLSTTRWGRVGALLGLLALTLVAFWTKRESLRWTVLAVTLVYLGFLDGGFLSVSHVTAAISVGLGVFLGDLSLLIMVAFTVATTLIWGRVFCGYLCPFGALQDFIARVVPERLQRSPVGVIHQRGLWIKYAILAVLVIAALAGVRAPLYGYVEPFGTVFFLSTSLVLWALALAFLGASAVIPRFYCRYVCPLGAALALGSLIAPGRIRRVEHCTHCKVCEQHCPTGAISGADIDFKECVRCSDCEVKLLQKAGVCQHPIGEVHARLARIRVPDRSELGV